MAKVRPPLVVAVVSMLVAAAAPFRVFFTPIWPPTKEHAPASREQLRAAVEGGADRAPKPGEYKFTRPRSRSSPRPSTC